MQRQLLIFTLSSLFLGVNSCAAVKRSHLHGVTEGDRFDKVMIVIYENEGFTTAAANPFFRKLAEKGALLTNFHGEMHPSQPNYIAMISGDTHGVKDDVNHDISAGHIGDLLELKGKTWKNYAEGYPGGCFTGAKSGRYVRKHTPFLSFKNIQENPKRCARVVSASELKQDIAQGAIPDFSIYTPDLDNDGHDTGIEGASKALMNSIDPLIHNRAFMKGMLLIVTFDEDDKKEGNRIYTALIGDSVAAGTSSAAAFNHYSILKLIEDRWSLGNL